METDKSSDTLRAEIEREEVESSGEDTGTQGVTKSTELDASTEGTSKEATADNPTVETSKEDEWVVPGRFRTNADVLNSYGEAESLIGRQASEIQKLRGMINESPRRGESLEEKTTRLRRFAEELEKDPEEALTNRMRKIVNEVKGDVKASEFKRVYEARKNDDKSDFAELEPIMTQIATAYGDMVTENNMQNDPRLLDILHLAARGVKTQELAQRAKADGVKKGEERARQKGNARIEGSSGTPKTKKIDIDRLTAAQLRSAIEKGDLE